MKKNLGYDALEIKQKSKTPKIQKSKSQRGQNSKTRRLQKSAV